MNSAGPPVSACLIRDVADLPRSGVLFKNIMPLPGVAS
jgi:hypothetical protein